MPPSGSNVHGYEPPASRGTALQSYTFTVYEPSPYVVGIALDRILAPGFASVAAVYQYDSYKLIAPSLIEL